MTYDDEDQNPNVNPNRDLPTPTHPNTEKAAASIAKIGEFVARDLTAQDMLDALRSALAQDGNGQAMMFCQSQVLDMLFHRLINKALSGVDEQGEMDPNYVDDTRIDMALRTQRQCRSTVDLMNDLQKLREKQAEDEWGRK
jgi:hypothetical protein